MNFIRKTFRFIYGFFLFIGCTRTLYANRLLKGKRVAIVGAANSAYQTGKGAYIDGFDLVIRVNKAPHLLKDDRWKADIGSRANILFHSFFENEVSGGGALDLRLYDRLGIQFIINPIPTYSGFRVTFNFYKKYLVRRIIYTLPRKEYNKMQEQLGQFRPTIGFCALRAALECDFSELYITGFTFFKTPFGAGYRDDMRDVHQVQQYIKDAGLHNPDLEFKQFLKLLQQNRHKNILLDSTLQSIVGEY